MLNTDPGILRVNEVLIDLTKIDGRRALIAELKFFGGYKIEEIVEITGTPLGTVKRQWAAAKAFIKLQLGVSASTGADVAMLPTLID
jgi:DNA-directed RNA polymerase specialized sigma24 family protein